MFLKKKSKKPYYQEKITITTFEELNNYINNTKQKIWESNEVKCNIQANQNEFTLLLHTWEELENELPKAHIRIPIESDELFDIITTLKEQTDLAWAKQIRKQMKPVTTKKEPIFYLMETTYLGKKLYWYRNNDMKLYLLRKKKKKAPPKVKNGLIPMKFIPNLVRFELFYETLSNQDYKGLKKELYGSMIECYFDKF